MRDLSKMRCYKCNKLEHLDRNSSQLRDQTRATIAMVGSESEDDILKISNKVSTFFNSGF